MCFSKVENETTHTPSNTMNVVSSCISGPEYPSLSSSIRYAHRIKIRRIDKARKAQKILNRAEMGVEMLEIFRALVYRAAYSMTNAINTHSVNTWKERPAMDTSTATLDPPDEVEERAPPTAWRQSEKMSQGMNIQR